MTKVQKQESAFQEYLNTYNISLDFNSYKSFEQNSSVSKGLFNTKSFEKKILNEKVKGVKNEKIKKQFLKDYKNGFEKYGDFNLDDIKVKDKTITCSKWGFSKSEQFELCYIDGTLSLYKTLFNKKNDRPIMKVYKINWNTMANAKPSFIFVSNQYGIHFRKSEMFLKNFTESAALRKQFEIR